MFTVYVIVAGDGMRGGECSDGDSDNGARNDVGADRRQRWYWWWISKYYVLKEAEGEW